MKIKILFIFTQAVQNMVVKLITLNMYENHLLSKMRLPDNISNFTAETIAIDLALSYSSQNLKDNLYTMKYILKQTGELQKN